MEKTAVPDHQQENRACTTVLEVLEVANRGRLVKTLATSPTPPVRSRGTPSRTVELSTPSSPCTGVTRLAAVVCSSALAFTTSQPKHTGEHRARRAFPLLEQVHTHLCIRAAPCRESRHGAEVLAEVGSRRPGPEDPVRVVRRGLLSDAAALNSESPSFATSLVDSCVRWACF